MLRDPDMAHHPAVLAATAAATPPLNGAVSPREPHYPSSSPIHHSDHFPPSLASPSYHPSSNPEYQQRRPSQAYEWTERRGSIAPSIGSGIGSAAPSPDTQRRGSDAYVSSSRRTSDAFLARRANDALAFSDHPVPRRASDPVDDDGRVGVLDPYAERQYSELKVLGDGSFGTVWLCDWHSPVKPDVLLSAMQCGAGARPEWAGKRLVALKRMKRVWEGGWRQARTLGELVSLRDIPPHPAVIPLYDAFISPRSRELYFVFECMEGNLYQLTKSRKGRPLAAGLIASCFHQIVTGLYHIHKHGYFHRDMKPENLLVTTTGLCDYLSTAAVNDINARIAAGETDAGVAETRIEKDVQVIIKLADFGLARAINSKPPYTEYVSTRWYRAPEVLLRSTEYGAPVDMWALGAILAEMINLKPLFPGASEIDQVYRICDMLGDPSPENGPDERGRIYGGGRWNTGIKLAKKVGFSFPKRKPVHLRSLFPESTPPSLVDCIANLLRYNPRYRMTSAQCMDHPYFHEVLPHLQRMPPLPRIPFSQGQPTSQPPRPPTADLNVPSRQLPPSHSHRAAPVAAFAHTDGMRNLPPPASVDIRTPDDTPTSGYHHGVSYFGRPGIPHHDSEPRSGFSSPLVHQLRELDLPTEDLASYGQRRWSEEQAAQAALRRQSQAYEADHNRRASAVHSQYGSIIEGGVPMSAETSSTSLANLQQSLSATSLHRADPHPQQASPHVMAYVRQQQMLQQQALQQQQAMLSQSTPNLTRTSTRDISPPQLGIQAQSTMALPMSSQHAVHQLHQQPLHPHQVHQQHAQIHQHHQQHQQLHAASKLLPGKKKKWGLGSVFGGAANGSKSGTSLPIVDEQGFSSSTSSLKRTQSGHYAEEREAQAAATPQPAQPPMDAKAAKKLAERQARELAQAKREAAERAQKERARAVLQKRQQLVNNRGSGGAGELEYNGGDAVPSATAGLKQPPIARQLGYAQHPSHSVQSLNSLRSTPSQYEFLDVEHGDGGRNKARKTTEDDDHSSIGRASARSRSMLSVGTVDSDPGPRRARDVWPDPSLQAQRRTPSHPNVYHAVGQPTSTASFESQLATQLQRATVASASDSSLSLGRPHDSSRSLTRASGRGISSQLMEEKHSPYGHPQRYPSHMRQSSRSTLPSIGDWAEGQEINPMFRVPRQHASDETSLPPFAALASVADARPPQP